MRNSSGDAARGSVIAALLLGLWLTPGLAAAQNEMYFAQTPIPARLTEQRLKGFMRGHHTKALREESDHKKWKFNIGVFLRRPAGDLEAHLLFYDVESGAEVFVSEMTVFLSDRNENTFLQPITLERPMFKPNNRYHVVLTIRRQTMARKDFELIGQRDERSGVVSFSDSETQDPDEVAARAAARQQAEQRAAAENAEGVSELEAREQLAAEAAALEQQDESDEDTPAPEAVAPQSGGCASCSSVGRGGRAGGVAVVAAALAVAVATRRRRFH